MMSTYYCIQLCTFFTIFQTPLPSNTEIYLDQFRDLIELSMLEPDVVIGAFHENFNYKQFMGFED